MAQYGNQHRLRQELLEQRGYFAHWLQTVDDDSYRFWHPVEIALIHGAWSGFWTDHQFEQNWKGLGNQIAIPHALWVLIQGLNMLKERHLQLDWSELLAYFDQHRLRASELHQEIYPSGSMWMNRHTRFLLHEDPIQHLFQEDLNQLPHDHLWTPELGILRLSSYIDKRGDCIGLQGLRHWNSISFLASQREQLDATAPIRLMYRCRIIFPGHPKQFLVEHATPVKAVLALWKGTLRLESDAWEFDDQDRLFPVDDPPTEWEEDEAGICVPVLQKDMFDFRYIHHREMVQSLLQVEEADILWHDQFDLVPLRANVVPGMFLGLHSWTHTKLSLTSTQILDELLEATGQCHWDHRRDSHSIAGAGSMEGCQLWATIWESSLTNEGRASFHLEVSSDLSENTFQVEAKIGMNTAIPPDAFRLWWAVRAARSTLDCLRIPSGIFVAFKWCKRLIWEGHLSPETEIAKLIALLQQLWMPVIRGEEIRLIHGFSATRLSPDLQLGYLTTLSQQGKAYVLHMVTRIQGGGGGGRNPQAISLKNEVAGTLLDLQYELSWISKAVDSLFNHLGHAAVAALMNGKKETRATAVLQAMKQIGLEMPRKRSGALDSQSSAREIQAFKRKPPEINLSTVTIMQGFLLNEDDSNALQLTTFVPQSSGVFLAHLDQAMPWIRENSILSKDELGIIVVTQKQIETSLKHQRVTLPCDIPGADPIILAGILIQFGEKQLKCVEGVHRLSDPACGSIAFTLWKQDWDPEDWTRILESTTPFIGAIFAESGCPELIKSTWGRSLRNRNKPVHAAQASSIQLHGSVAPENIPRVLQASGLNRIFCTPKGSDVRQDQSYRVIWTEGDIPRLTSLSKQTAGCLGLVKGREGLGLRFKQEDFLAAWRIICTSKEAPPDLSGATLVKVQPLPFGTSKEQWALTYKWAIRPIRQVGARAWLIATTEDIPSGILLFNAAPVLARPLPPKTEERKSPVIAGDAMLSWSGQTTNSSPAQSVDPWAQYLASHGRPVASSAPRSVVGPTESKFQEQTGKLTALEARIASIESSTTAFQSETQKQITQLDTNLRQQAHDTQNRLHSIGLRFDEHQKEVAQQLMASSQSLEASLVKTMRHENQAIHGTLAALQEMFQENLGRKKPKESTE